MLLKSITIEKPSFAKVEGEWLPSDSKIPAKVRSDLERTGRGCVTVVLADNLLWIACDRQAKCIDLNQYEPFAVCYMTPAKGGGFIAIQAWPKGKQSGCTTILEFGIYSDRALEAAVRVAAKLESLLGYKLEQDRWGPDC